MIGMIGRRYRVLLIIGLAVLSLAVVPLSSNAQTDTPTPAYPRLPRVTMCAKSDANLTCYDTRRQRRFTTPDTESVEDFAIAPDGEWVAYRANDGTDDKISIRGIFRDDSLVIDPFASVPSDFRAGLNTIAWSPLGDALAYVVEDGLRIAYPHTQQETRYLGDQRLLYVDLLFAPDGLSLAARTDEDTWLIFAIRYSESGSEPSIQLINRLPRGELAWMDSSSVVFAGERSGISRFDITKNPPPALWTTPNDRYTKLQTRPATGDVAAFSIGTSEEFGSLVSIGADGAIRPLSAQALDTRIDWILDGQLMVYLTSGTAILVRPESGLENTVNDLRGVRAIDFGAPPPTAVESSSLDADLYYLYAPQGEDRSQNTGETVQVWRAPRNGDPVVPVTTMPRDVQTFGVSPNKARIAVISGNDLTIQPLPLIISGFLTPTPNRFAPQPSPTPIPPVLVDNLQGDRFLIRWSNTGTLIAYSDRSGVYTLPILDGLTANGSPTQVLPAGDYREIGFSPDSRYLYAVQSVDNRDTLQVRPLDPGAPILDLTSIQDTQLGGVLFGNRGLIVSAGQNGIWTLALWPFSQQTGTSVTPTVLATESWPISNLREADSGSSVLYLERRNWSAAPGLLTLWSQPLAGERTRKSIPFRLSDAQLSPTGRYVIGGLNLSSDDERGTILLADTQSGSIVIFNPAQETNVDSYTFQWVF